MQTNSCKYESLPDNPSFAHIDGPEVQKDKVNIELTVKETSRAFGLSLQTEGIVQVPCDHCLDEVEQPVTPSDKLMVGLGRGYVEEGDNLIVTPEEEGKINITQFMYEFIVLAIPVKCMHAPGERNKAMTSKLNRHLRTSGDDDTGESFGVGKDIVMKGEAEEQVDPRWNELKKILSNN